MEASGRSRMLCRVALVVNVLLITAVVGLRYHTGADWSMYILQYRVLNSTGEVYEWEPGFFALMHLFRAMTDNYYVLQFFVAAFTIILSAHYYRKHSEYPVFCLALFYFFFFNNLLMAQLRQAIALGIIVCSVRYVYDRQFVRFCLMVLLASLFHFSAIIALPLYFCASDWKKVINIVVLTISELFALFPGLIAGALKWLMPFMPSLLSSRTDDYMSDADFSGAKEFNTGLYTLIAFAIVIFMIFYIRPRNRKENFAINTLVMAMAIKNISLGFAILERFQPYYIVFGLVAYGYLFHIHIPVAWQHLYFRLGTCVLLFAFFFTPYITALRSTAIDPLTNRPMNYSLVPYYNAISHPRIAEGRKDWSQ